MGGHDTTQRKRQQKRRDQLREMGYKHIGIYVHGDDAETIAKVKAMDQSATALADWQEKHKST